VKRRLSPRTLGVLVAVLVLAYVAGGYFLLVAPKKSKASRLEGEIAQTQIELAAAQAALAAQDDTQPIAVADIFRLATAMPNTADMPGILLELQRIADETGIRFTSITPQASGPAGSAGSFVIVPVAVAFDGTFYALSDFLFRLRTLVGVRRGELHARGRLFAVESFDFAEAPSGFPTLSANLQLRAYVYGDTVPVTGATAPEEAPAAAPPPATTTSGAEVPPPSGSEAAGAGASG
jgi:Tfp pilus assembly protein PilO